MCRCIRHHIPIGTAVRHGPDINERRGLFPADERQRIWSHNRDSEEGNLQGKEKVRAELVVFERQLLLATACDVAFNP